MLNVECFTACKVFGMELFFFCKLELFDVQGFPSPGSLLHESVESSFLFHQYGYHDSFVRT